MRKHIPFLIMGASSGTLFLSNILAKKTFSSDEYEYFSYFMTVASILSSFALLGLEQLIIRFGTPKGGILYISRTPLCILGVTLFLVVLFSGSILRQIFSGDAVLDFSWLATATLALTLINYNLLRVKSSFVGSQIANGVWRFSVLIFLVSYTVDLLGSVQFALTLALVAALVVNIAIAIKEFKTIRVVSTVDPVAMISMGFVFSLAIMTVLGNFDRVIAERAGDQDLFPRYMHYSMILVMPFNMIAAYIGFKEATAFKLNFSKSLLFQKAFSCTAKISAAFMLAVIAVFPVSGFIDLELSLSSVAATYLLVATKCFYSLFSAAMGARGSAKEVWFANILSVVLLGTIFVVYVEMFKVDSIESILWLFVLLWVSRLASYYSVLSRKKDD